MRKSNNIGYHLLSLDVRRRKVGFVVVDSSNHMLDFGIKRCDSSMSNLAAEVRKRTEDLLSLFHPQTILMRVPPARIALKDTRIATILKVLRQQAEARSVRVREFQRQAIKGVFLDKGLGSKCEIASWLATQFPELAWKPLGARKSWQSEPYRTSVYDAAATATVHLGLVN
jgi:hypothetical protein